jgi:hypothetical protein
MKTPSKDELLKAIDKSTEELHQKIDMHRYLMATILDKKVSEKRLHHVVLPNSHRELRLQEAIKEAIEVMERTRKAFKSKRLEALRKRLMQELIESE